MRRELMTQGEILLERRLVWELWVSVLPWYRQWWERLKGP